MIGGLGMLLMQHLMTTSGPTYSYSSTRYTEETNQLQPNETVMFIELAEFNLDGTTQTKRINAAYIKYMEACEYRLIDISTFKETGEKVDATRITMFDDSQLFVADSLHELGFRLQVV